MDDLRKLAAKLEKAASGEVRTEESLAPYTSYGVGGKSAVWVAPGNKDAVGKVLEILEQENIPFFVLGGGSNLLIADEGWPGVTLYIGENLSGWQFFENEVEVNAGSKLLELIRDCARHGLGGMELMAGIPGNLGGALRMNAGAFGQEIESSVLEVRGFLRNGEEFKLKKSGIDFGYRRATELEDTLITSARLSLNNEDAEDLRIQIKEILALRTKKQPLEHPSCGSVFKRPTGYFAGTLIEEAGLKGERVGDAMVSVRHAGFILNVGKATAKDIYELIRKIETSVEDRFGVKLEREVKLVGFADEE